jgi:hypothetical protein
MCFGRMAICTRLSVAKVADGECRWIRMVEGSTISADFTGVMNDSQNGGFHFNR